MSLRLSLRFASCALLLAPLAALVVSSCSGDSSSDVPAADSGLDVVDTFVATDTTLPPLEDSGPVRKCTLEGGSDPVALCLQKRILQQWHDAAFIKDLGVAESWDSTTFLPDKSSAGETLHDPVDDVRYAAALSRYRVSAKRYGDTELRELIEPDIEAIAVRIKAELTVLPATHLAELYVELRAASAGYRTLDYSAADAFDAFADQVGAAIYATYHPLTTPPPGDAGADAADASADATDTKGDAAGDVDAGDAVAPLDDGILGTAASGGGYQYSAAEATTGAYALLDMAMRHATDKANAYAWQRAAVSTIEHVHARAREASTGMYYQVLIAMDGAATDTLAATTSSIPNDALLADDQATIALFLSRAQELVTKNKSAFGGIPAYPFDAHAVEVLTSANGAHALWDDGAKGYLEGWVPSTSSMIAMKPTRANARFFAALHRVYATVGTPLGAQLKPLRIVMTAQVPEHSGLLSTLPDQEAFLRRSPPSFDFGASAPSEPRERSYFSADTAAALDGLWEQWFGLPF